MPRQSRYFFPGLPQHIFQGKPDNLITERAVHRSLATTRERRLEAYRNLLADQLDPELLAYIRDTANACRVIVNDQFEDPVEAMLGRCIHPARIGRPRKSYSWTPAS